MALVKLLLVVQAAMALAAPTQASPRIAVRDNAGNGTCVDGSPTETGGFKIFYKQVEPASNSSETGYIIDPAWQSLHSTVGGSTHLSVGGQFIPYGEFKCQYSCNGRPGCVSYVAYEGKDYGGDNNAMDCYFFDALIESDNIVPKPSNGTELMTHAYNRLCKGSGG